MEAPVATGVPNPIEPPASDDINEAGRAVTVHTATTTVRADHVLVCTGIPFVDRGLFFARLEPKRSYVLPVEAGDDRRRREPRLGAPQHRRLGDVDIGFPTHSAGPPPDRGAPRATPDRSS